MFRKVIVATDLSPASERTLGCVSAWRSSGLETVVVTHLHNIRNTGGLEAALRRDHEPKLEKQAELLRKAGLSASWRLEFGVPYMDMNRIAEEERAEAVVMGSHGRTWLKDVWLGSIADAILQHSTVPVLVVRIPHLASLPSDESYDFCAGLFGRVLFATDFSNAAEHALESVSRCAERIHGRFHLVHVHEVSRLRSHQDDMLEQINRVDTARLERMAEALRKAGAQEVTHEIRVDHPVKGILRAVDAWGPRLVILGSRGRSHFAELLLGCTAHYVARLSPTPVLIVPGPFPNETLSITSSIQTSIESRGN